MMYYVTRLRKNVNYVYHSVKPFIWVAQKLYILAYIQLLTFIYDWKDNKRSLKDFMLIFSQSTYFNFNLLLFTIKVCWYQYLLRRSKIFWCKKAGKGALRNVGGHQRFFPCLEIFSAWQCSGIICSWLRLYTYVILFLSKN